jgi:hypothetical protein
MQEVRKVRLEEEEGEESQFAFFFPDRVALCNPSGEEIGSKMLAFGLAVNSLRASSPVSDGVLRAHVQTPRATEAVGSKQCSFHSASGCIGGARPGARTALSARFVVDPYLEVACAFCKPGQKAEGAGPAADQLVADYGKGDEEKEGNGFGRNGRIESGHGLEEFHCPFHWIR